MLSILIPIYNRDVRKLVAELKLQCGRLNIPFQILCFDDGSKPRYHKLHQEMETWYGVNYLRFAKNMGRAKMRNKLGYNAQYDKILFLDCDSRIIHKRFVKKYVECLDQHTVIYGGTRYQKKQPAAADKTLHWLVGQKREALPLEKRRKKPTSSFRSNNFIIDRNVFLSHQFDERVSKYGHEDTLLAQDLEQAGHQIHHIDNPVYHSGIERASVFLEKTKESIENLVELRREDIIIETRLSHFYETLKQWSLLPLALFLYNFLEEKILKNLHGKSPSLRLFDLWKINVLNSFNTVENKKSRSS